MGDDRRWMYEGWKNSGAHSDEWVVKATAFVNRAFSLSSIGKVKCPCNKCRNFFPQDKKMMSLHLCRVGFMPGYELWVHHGESCPQDAVEEEDDDRMHEMVEALIPEIDLDSEDPPTPEV